MTEYGILPKTRASLERLLLPYFAEIYSDDVQQVINHIQEIIRQDIEIVDEASASDTVEYGKPLGYHGDRER